MEFQTSQFDYLFLLNIPIPIVTQGGEIFNLATPNIYDYHITHEYKLIEQVFLVSMLELQLDPTKFGFVAEGYLELILGLKMTDENNKLFDLFEQITGLEVTKQNITCNGVPLVEEDVLEIRYAFLLAAGRIDINGDFIQGNASDDDDELSRKMAESEARIKAIKDSNNQADKALTFKQVILLITYELNRSFEELQKLNFYGINELYKLANMASYDKITKIAAGNGLMPKDQAYKNILSD